MKKRFSRRRNAVIGSVPHAGPVALGLLTVVLIVLALRFLAPGALVALGTPVWTAGNALTAGAGGVGAFFADRDAVVRERDALRRESAALYVRAVNAEARTHDLERLLGDRVESSGGTVAGVLARPPVSPYDVLILDQGTNAGVVVGARVYGPGGMPLGVIEEASAGSSRALLHSTPAKETESWIGEDRIPVTLVGEGSGAMSAIVARDAGIEPGDFVYAAGPGARAVGTVISVENDPSLPRSHVDIRPLANPFSFTWVTVGP